MNTIKAGSIRHKQNQIRFGKLYTKLADLLNLKLGSVLRQISLTTSRISAVTEEYLPLLTEPLNSQLDMSMKASGILSKMSSHPVHLINKDGVTMPSAFIPFCAFKTKMMGKDTGLFSFPICNKFRETILDGQLCYSLQLSDVIPEQGKKGELLLLLDYNKERSVFIKGPKKENLGEDNTLSLEEVREEDATLAKVFIHTLNGYTGFGAGSYVMESLKKILVTKQFQEKPNTFKKCQIESSEECYQEEYLKHGLQDCNCITLEFSNLTQHKVI